MSLLTACSPKPGSLESCRELRDVPKEQLSAAEIRSCFELCLAGPVPPGEP